MRLHTERFVDGFDARGDFARVAAGTVRSADDDDYGLFLSQPSGLVYCFVLRFGGGGKSLQGNFPRKNCARDFFRAQVLRGLAREVSWTFGNVEIFRLAHGLRGGAAQAADARLCST